MIKIIIQINCLYKYIYIYSIQIMHDFFLVFGLIFIKGVLFKLMILYIQLNESCKINQNLLV